MLEKHTSHHCTTDLEMHPENHEYPYFTFATKNVEFEI